jgi:hypothetical protein
LRKHSLPRIGLAVGDILNEVRVIFERLSPKDAYDPDIGQDPGVGLDFDLVLHFDVVVINARIMDFLFGYECTGVKSVAGAMMGVGKLQYFRVTVPVRGRVLMLGHSRSNRLLWIEVKGGLSDACVA